MSIGHHTPGMSTIFQNLTLKIQGQGHSSRSQSGPTSYWLKSLSFHVNRPTYSCDRTYSKFNHDNPRSSSWVMWVRWKVEVIQIAQHSFDVFPFCFISFGSTIAMICMFHHKKCLDKHSSKKVSKRILPELPQVRSMTRGIHTPASFWVLGPITLNILKHEYTTGTHWNFIKTLRGPTVKNSSQQHCISISPILSIMLSLKGITSRVFPESWKVNPFPVAAVVVVEPGQKQ